MIELADVLEAQDRVRETSRHTPLEYSHTYSSMTDADVHFKLETFQRTGSFKIRGATNRVATLSEAEKDAGVVTASAGNHAQGVALAATRSGVDSTIVMPEHAPISKVKATRNYGAKVVLDGTDYNEAAQRAHELEEKEDRTYVHAFDDEYVMAGQGTIGLEILEDCPDVDTVVVPIGGGGLISGVAAAIKEKRPETRVIGVQAEGASSAATSLEKGERISLDGVDTIADGIATRSVGEKPFRHIEEHVDEVVTVSDSEIAVAIVYLLERSKTLVEGAGAVPLAALLFEHFEYDAGETIVPILSGGNVDLNTLTNIIVRGLVETGRYLKIRTVLKDRPGALEKLLEIFTEYQVNIYAIYHDRTSREVEMSDTEVEIELEMRGPDHVDAFLESLREEGYVVDILA
ncbi:threonine dehydratase [Natrialba chahannaoensis JCM 10990]|uniref:threonine ammonia-lyase n=1 Tax=Natrialba chahannaoensis JCM 10990 TaxID=1227492 RepID=M0AW69_9EURY|nr:threonine ammonia-lyase [Natrialba chahannaoensis]ELZ01639.1 threonine dehydratase [Natrialba chahannaoensis JCM 10990]